MAAASRRENSSRVDFHPCLAQIVAAHDGVDGIIDLRKRMLTVCTVRLDTCGISPMEISEPAPRSCAARECRLRVDDGCLRLADVAQMPYSNGAPVSKRRTFSHRKSCE